MTQIQELEERLRTAPQEERDGINTELTEAYRAASRSAVELEKQIAGAIAKMPAPQAKRGRSCYQTSSESD